MNTSKIVYIFTLILCLVSFPITKVSGQGVHSLDGVAKRSFVGQHSAAMRAINENEIIELNRLASNLNKQEKYEEAVAVSEECLEMIRGFQGIYNELYHHQLVNHATYLYNLDRYPDCIVYESKALNIAKRIKLPTELDRLRLMSETADELGKRKSPNSWNLNLRSVLDECIAQPNFTPDDIDNYKNYNEQFQQLESQEKEESPLGITLLKRLIPITLSLGETEEAIKYINIVGNNVCKNNGPYTIENARILVEYALALVQAYDYAVPVEKDIFDIKYIANGAMEVLDSCGVDDDELRVKALMARSYSYSHTGIAGNALDDAEVAVAMAKRLSGKDSELYDYASYYLTQVKIRYDGLSDQIYEDLKNIYSWRCKHYGAKHSTTISALLALAQSASDRGDYESSKMYFEEYFDAQTSLIATCFEKMTPQQQGRYWDMYSGSFQRMIPKMEICHLEDNSLSSCMSEISFNSQLLSKGMKLYVHSRPDTHDLTLKWRDIQRNLKDGDIAVEFVTYNKSEQMKTRFFNADKLCAIPSYIETADTYAAIVISKSSEEPEIIRLFDTNEIGYLYFNNEYRKQELSKWLWAPILEKYPSTKCIYFSPDGELYNIPIESLPYYAGNGLMSDRFSLIRLTSTRELNFPNRSSSNASGLLFGGIDYDSDSTTIGENREAEVGIPYLEGTEEEVLQIKQIIDSAKSANAETILYTQKKATEDILKNHSFFKESILHIATHGFYYSLQDSVYTGTPMQRSGLLMAGAANHLFMSDLLEEENDGILTSEEISHLNLNGINLAVLSACDTAKGDITGDGVEGLQFGFKLAGVQSILMSLWKVDDEATCKLMTEFYSNWIGKKMTKHDALEAAKKTVRETKGWEEPKYWAAFILLDGLD